MKRVLFNFLRKRSSTQLSYRGSQGILQFLPRDALTTKKKGPATPRELLIDERETQK